MRRKTIRTLPSLDKPFKPAGAIGKGVAVARSQRIQTLPGGFFRIRGRPSGKYSIATNYARVITDQRRADEFDKKSRYYSAKTRRKKGKLSRIVIKTHNKEYTERITKQDGLRRLNDRQTKKLRWLIVKAVSKLRPFSLEETRDLVRSVGEWAATAIDFFPGEKFFLSKGPHNVARKLSLKRIEFIRNNICELERLVNLMREKRLIAEGGAREIFSAIETVYEEGRDYWKYLPKED